MNFYYHLELTEQLYNGRLQIGQQKNILRQIVDIQVLCTIIKIIRYYQAVLKHLKIL
jgi:hypothetical protein